MTEKSSLWWVLQYAAIAGVCFLAGYVAMMYALLLFGKSTLVIAATAFSVTLLGSWFGGSYGSYLSWTKNPSFFSYVKEKCNG